VRRREACAALVIRLDEAANSLRAVVQSDCSSRSSRELLAKVLFRKALLCAREGDWNEAAVALREAFSHVPETRQPEGGDTNIATTVAVVYQLGGLHSEALRLWEDARRADPTDVGAIHSLLISSLVRALRGKVSQSDEDGLHHWRAAAVNALLLMNEEAFVEEFRSRCERRYGRSISSEEIGQLWASFEQMLKKHLPLPASAGLTFDVERAGERALKKLGGLRPFGGQDGSRVMGSVMLRHLGYSKEFGTFIASLLKERKESGQTIRIVKVSAAGTTHRVLPNAKEMLRLLRYFSCYSPSQVLLDQGFPQMALESLEYSCEEKCSTGPMTYDAGPRWSPHVCRQSCEKFFAVNPAYAEIENGSYLLWRGAVELAAEAHAALGRALLSPAGPDIERAFEHWHEALRMSGEDDRAEVLRTAAGCVRACARVLSGEGEFGKAVHILEKARGLCGPEFIDEMDGMLSEALNCRGVQTANETDPDWDASLSDFKRSVELNPFVPVRGRNLALALRQKAITVYTADMRGAARLLIEAHGVLLKGIELTPGEPELTDEMSVLLDDMEYLSVRIESRSAHFYTGESQARGEDKALAAELLSLVRSSRKLRIKVLDAGGVPPPAPRIRMLLPEETPKAAEAVRARASRIKIYE
jgi:tetratricopeptide (TPR) repeat protein